jgi:plasmid stabilization system protein ParE
MAKRIVWTRKAQLDRKEILHYWRINNQSPEYSRKLNELFKKNIALIAVHPHLGRETDFDNVRIKLVRDYLIFYEEAEKTIIILTIWDNRRNPDQITY